MEWVEPNVIQAIPAIIAGIATCHLRSSLLSDLREIGIIASNPVRYGTITKIPIVVLEYPLDNVFTIWGIQKNSE
jgi:hypothetical protein